MSDLESRLRARDGNNLDFIRFCAAALVIGAHTFELPGNSREPWSNLTHDQTMGHVGVSIFFFVSGLLITRSWLERPSAPGFVLRRAGRILPGLAVAALFCVFVVGPLATSWSLADYFSRRDTYAFLFNAFGLPPHFFLPGAFEGNFSHVVNGSLWTMPQEILCYGGVLLVGWTGFLSPRRFPFALAGVLAFLLWPYLTYVLFLGGGTAWWQLHLFPQDRLFFDFLLGAVACVYREKLFLHGGIALLVLFLIAVTVLYPAGYFLRLFGLPYLVLYAIQARTPRLHAWGRHGDFSFGLYIYAFPVQQLILHYLGRNIAGGWFFTLSLVLTLGLAFLSWRWVEQPALALTRRLGKRGKRDDAGGGEPAPLLVPVATPGTPLQA